MEKLQKIMSAEANLKKLNIDLPKAPKPVGDYVAYKKIDNLVFISGQVSFAKDGKLIVGKVGEDLTLEQGQDSSKGLCYKYTCSNKSGL